MSLVDLIFGTPASLSDGNGNEVILDPVISESRAITADVTDNAVEDGSVISDHVHIKPDTFSVKTIFADQNDLTAAALSALFTADKSVTEKIGMLEEWQQAGTLLVYSGPVFSGFLTEGYDLYVEDVVITKIDVSRDSDTGSGISVTIALTQIMIAYSVLVEINLPQAARSRTRRGRTATRSGSAAKPRSSSILARLAR